jgi:N-acetyl-anhydromuramyl-L-alanine amidase AmpD
MTERAFPHVNVRRASPNCSSRAGARPTLIVIHVTAGHNRPGIADLAGLGGWFASHAAQVSSHVATDNEGLSARFVNDALKAWHVAAYNRMSLGIEQVAPGTGAEITDAMLRETARWVATWSRNHDIPIREAAVSGGRVVRAGVIRHSQLGTLGGGHSDPGPYDMHRMLNYARRYRKAQAS